MSSQHSTSYVRDARGPYFAQVFHYEVDDYFQRIEKKRRAHAIAVYVVVARHAGQRTNSFPSLTTLCDLTGLARATVVDALRALKAAGLIAVTKRTSSQGQATNLYELVSSSPELAVSSSPELEEETVLKKSVESNDSRAMPNVVGLEKHIVDEIYAAMRDAKLRLPNADFTFHLGRAKDMLEKDEPTDAELEALAAAFVRLWKIRGKADAPAALMEMRRQQARVQVLAEDAPARQSAASRKAGYEWLFEEKEPEGEAKRDLDAELKELRESA